MNLLQFAFSASILFLVAPNRVLSQLSSIRGGNDGKGNKWNPELLGPDYLVPLTLQCFQLGYGTHPCSTAESVAAAYKDKDIESRLDGDVEIIVNQNADGGDTAYIPFTDGIATSSSSEVDYNDGYDDSGDEYLMYCCAGPQFIEGGEGESR